MPIQNRRKSGIQTQYVYSPDGQKLRARNTSFLTHCVTLKKYQDNILLIVFTLSMIIYSTVINGQTSHTLPTEYMNVTKDITDVDSVFETNFSKLYTLVNDKSNIKIDEHKILEFISVVCMISGIDFILPNFHKPIMIEKKDVDNIRHWYDRNKSKIDLNTLKRFYVAVARPWCLNFNSFEELQDFYGDLDNYVICDEEFKRLMKSQRTKNK